MSDVKAAGEQFLSALERYIRLRLEHDKSDLKDRALEYTEHEVRYREYLEALGVKQENEPLFTDWMKLMEQMKTSRGPC